MMNVMRRIATSLSLAIVVLACVATAPDVAPTGHRPASTLSDSTVIQIVGDSRVANSTFPAMMRFQHRLQQRLCGINCGSMQVTSSAAGGRCLVARGCGQPPIVDTWATEVLAANPRPTTVIVQVGVNDMFYQLSDGQIADGFKAIKSSGSAAGIRVLLSTVIPMTSGYASRPVVEQQRQNINHWLRDYYGTDVIDWDAVLKAPWGPYLDAPYDSGDGLHPNVWAVVLMADAIQDWQLS